LRDGAATSDESYFFQSALAQAGVDRDVVTAKGVVDMLVDVGVGDLTPVAWTLIMV
jgi:hypothetical protein